MGLIEAIPVETILSNADENDANGDGISGRPNWVTAADFVPAIEVGQGLSEADQQTFIAFLESL